MEKKLTNTVICILGPTACGKTALAVTLAKAIDAEIVSADSRQVYSSMDIGTGKDLHLYNNIPYHLINICTPGEKYYLARFQNDFENASSDILRRNKIPLLCGGTGLYIQAVLQDFTDTSIPENPAYRLTIDHFTDSELLELIKNQGANFKNMDTSTRKKKIRVLEKLNYILTCPQVLVDPIEPKYKFSVFGLNPDVSIRRKNISNRLQDRLENGLIEEVESLLKNGLSHDMLQYYGLEYKYVSLYLTGELSKIEMYAKLETEIHRFAKRQMTFFRSMETKGIEIKWLPETLNLEAKVEFMISNLK